MDDNIFMLDAHAIGNCHSHRRSAEMVVIYATSMVVAARARRCLINQEPQAEGGGCELFAINSHPYLISQNTRRYERRGVYD